MQSWSCPCSPLAASAQLHTVAASNNRDHVPQTLYYCLFTPRIYGCYSSRTSSSWWIAHSTQRQPEGCNNIPSFLPGLDRTGSGLKSILAGSGLDRTAIFLKIGGSDLDRTEKIFCFYVIIMSITKILVVIRFYRFVKW